MSSTPSTHSDPEKNIGAPDKEVIGENFHVERIRNVNDKNVAKIIEVRSGQYFPSILQHKLIFISDLQLPQGLWPLPPMPVT